MMLNQMDWSYIYAFNAMFDLEEMASARSWKCSSVELKWLNLEFTFQLKPILCILCDLTDPLPLPSPHSLRITFKGQSFRGRGRAIISWRWPSIKFFNKHNRKWCKLDIYSMTFSSIQNFVHCKNNSRVHVSSV